ncbi:MAG: serpin family protein [Acutalibacteraceae bacterium]|jgi:serine protease inhibitor
MKKIMCLLVILVMITLTACKETAKPISDNQSDSTASVESIKDTESVESIEGMKNNKAPMNIVQVQPKALMETKYGESYPAATTAAKGANDFAFRLSAELANQNGNKNFVCSPYSVWIPLAALVNATDAKNKAKLLAALSTAGISEADLNYAASRMLYDLTRQRDKKLIEQYGEDYYYNPLKISNAIFVGNNVTLKKDFAQTFMDYYRGSSINVDFRSKEAVDAVNKWASENTEGLITDIVREFDPNTVATIVNAIYFSDRWSQEFNPDNTKQDVFYSPKGETKAFYMLREGNSLPYYEDNKIQAIQLGFTKGGGMYIILPKDGDAIDLLSSMTSKYFEKIQEDSVKASGRLLLPRFSINSDSLSLKDTLIKLGVPLFDEKSAPLTGGLIEENIPVWLSSAMHRAVINVDEKGTTAAAVTALIAVTKGKYRPTHSFEMICNKPFVFVLYGNTHDGKTQILFTGIVNQP